MALLNLKLRGTFLKQSILTNFMSILQQVCFVYHICDVTVHAHYFLKETLSSQQTRQLDPLANSLFDGSTIISVFVGSIIFCIIMRKRRRRTITRIVFKLFACLLVLTFSSWFFLNLDRQHGSVIIPSGVSRVRDKELNNQCFQLDSWKLPCRMEWRIAQ